METAARSQLRLAMHAQQAMLRSQSPQPQAHQCLPQTLHGAKAWMSSWIRLNSRLIPHVQGITCALTAILHAPQQLQTALLTPERIGPPDENPWDESGMTRWRSTRAALACQEFSCCVSPGIWVGQKAPPGYLMCKEI
jgi:hypothetical protein